MEIVTGKQIIIRKWRMIRDILINCTSCKEDTKYVYCSWPMDNRLSLLGHIDVCLTCVNNRFDNAFFKAFLLGNVE